MLQLHTMESQPGSDDNRRFTINMPRGLANRELYLWLNESWKLQHAHAGTEAGRSEKPYKLEFNGAQIP